ncbi:MAG: 4-hydroxy-3-methylbut-2-enyl diphosphate reductase [Deltaproteobacteria bacterium]
MKRILIARSAGFCFGVKRAISIANETARSEGTPGGALPIHSLGPLIHNPQAVRDLEEKGVHVVESAEQVSCGKVIVRSHGITRAEETTLREKEVQIIDATCPFVRKAREHASRLSREGYAVIVVGDENHPEVKSIVSHIEPGVPILTSLEEIRNSRGGIRKAGIVAQTTQSFDHLLEFIACALRKFPEVRVFNTICNATILRQKESSAVAGRVERMIVLGGYNSANTRRLYEICREINPHTIHIETAAELDPATLRSVDRVGVTAGASTPSWIIDGLVETIRNAWAGEPLEVAYFK